MVELIRLGYVRVANQLTPAGADSPSSGAVLLAGGIAGIMYWSGSYPQGTHVRE